MDYYQFSFPGLNEEQQHKLLAMLSEAGFDGFEESADGLNAFIPITAWDENSFNKIIEINNRIIFKINYKRNELERRMGA
jgi:hypothetical protein